MGRQMTVLFQFSAILMTWKIFLKSQPGIRTLINLVALILFWFIWFSQDNNHCYEDILWETLSESNVFRDYKYFENDRFRTDLLSELSTANVEDKENGLNNLLNGCKRILDVHAPRKQKYAGGNHVPLWRRLCLRKYKNST